LFLSNNQLQYINWKFQRPVKLSDCDMSSNKFKCPIPDWTTNEVYSNMRLKVTRQQYGCKLLHRQ
jgi:hypothetical protein